MTQDVSCDREPAGVVYLIRNERNGKVYIGQTIRNVKARWRSHVFDARRGSSIYFHCAIRKHGVESFSIEVLQKCHGLEQLNEAEKVLIEKYEACNPTVGYNCKTGGYNSQPNVAARKKMSEAGRRREWSDETRQKLSAARKGKTLSTEHCQAMSRSRMGHKASPEARRNMSKAGFKRMESAELRNKISEATRGRKHSIEHRQKISSALLCHGCSAETRQRMSYANRARRMWDAIQLEKENEK